MLNLLLRMSSNMLKMVSSKFQSKIIEIEDFKINPVNPFTLTAPRRGE